MREYLKLTRAHTVPLEAVPAIIGAAIAVGSIWRVEVALWGIFGVLYHLTGYGHNSVADWTAGYDYADPNKQHHPLNRETISPRQAKLFIRGMFLITAAYAITLAAGSHKALTALGIGVIAGLLYNLKGKETEFKFIFISIAHSTVFAVPYLALGGDPSSIGFILGVVFMFTWVVFQISISGEVKDFNQEEANFLKNLGVVAEYTWSEKRSTQVQFSRQSKHYAYSLKAITVAASAGILKFLGTALGAAVILLLSSLMFLDMSKLMQSGEFNRKKRLVYMSRIEMATALIFVSSYTKVIGIEGAVYISVASVVWVLIGNRALWGTWIAPRV